MKTKINIRSIKKEIKELASRIVILKDKIKTKINIRSIKKEIKELAASYLFEIANQKLIDRVTDEVSQIMYKYGFEDEYDSSDFYRVIIGLNLKVYIANYNLVIEVRNSTSSKGEWHKIIIK